VRPSCCAAAAAAAAVDVLRCTLSAAANLTDKMRDAAKSYTMLRVVRGASLKHFFICSCFCCCRGANNGQKLVFPAKLLDAVIFIIFYACGTCSLS